MECVRDEDCKGFERKLSNEGAMVEKLIDADVTEAEISRYFGPRASKSGWKYADPQFVTAVEAASIVTLYCRVYGQKTIPNREISLAFARGLVYQSQKKKPVNWEEFAMKRQKFRENVRAVKAKKRVERDDGIDGRDSRPTVLGKRRCVVEALVDKENVMPVMLTPKVEANFVLCKREGPEGRGKGKIGKVVTAVWEDVDVQSMESVLEVNIELVKVSKTELEKSQAERVKTEGELRRARMMRDDRQVILLQSQRDMDNCSIEESIFREKIERNTRFLAQLQLSSIDHGP